MFKNLRIYIILLLTLLCGLGTVAVNKKATLKVTNTLQNTAIKVQTQNFFGKKFDRERMANMMKLNVTDKVKPSGKHAAKKKIGGTTLVTPAFMVIHDAKTYIASCFSYKDYAEARYEVKVGKSGSTMYIQGLFRNCPEAWIKGTIADDGASVTFEKDQYMGESEVFDVFSGESMGMFPAWFEYTEDFDSYCDVTLSISAEGIMDDAKEGLLAFALNDDLDVIDALGHLRLTPMEYEELEIKPNPTEVVVKGVKRDVDESEGGTGRDWDNEFFIYANRPLAAGETTIIEFDYSSSVAASTHTYCYTYPLGTYLHWGSIGDIDFTTETQHFYREYTVPAEADGMQAIGFMMAVYQGACDYHIKNVVWKLSNNKESLIDQTGAKNFYVKEGADTKLYRYDLGPEVTNEYALVDIDALDNMFDYVTLSAGTILAKSDNVKMSLAFTQEVYGGMNATAIYKFGGTEIKTNYALIGNTDPKDADGKHPGVSLTAPASGHIYKFVSEKDGYLSVLVNLLPNKKVSVSEDGAYIPYAVGMSNERFPSASYQLLGNEKGVVDVPPLCAEAIINHREPDYTGIDVSGPGIIRFKVKAGKEYLVFNNGSKLQASGYYFTQLDDDNSITVVTPNYPDECELYSKTRTPKLYTVYLDSKTKNVTFEGFGGYAPNATAMIKSNFVPSEEQMDYAFTGWSDGNTDNPRTLTVTGNIYLRSEYGYQNTSNLLVNGDAEKPWGNPNVRYDDKAKNYQICAWSRESGRNMDEDGVSQPHPADIVELPEGGHSFIVRASNVTSEGNLWDNQFWIQSPRAWKTGMQAKIHFRYKASQNATVQTEIHKQTPTDYLCWGEINDFHFTTDWQEYEEIVTFNEAMSGGWSIVFDLNKEVKTATDFYFDDLSWEIANELEEGYFVVGTDHTASLEYDFDNAVKFEKDGTYLVATVGTVTKPVSQIMVSTLRGSDMAFKGNTIRPVGAIYNDPAQWLNYDEASSSRISLPGLGVWRVRLDEDMKSMSFEMITGTIIDKPDIKPNPIEIVVEGQERDELVENGGTGNVWDNQLFIVANRSLHEGEAMVISFDYMATREAVVSAFYQDEEGYLCIAEGIGNIYFTPEWNHYEKTITVPKQAEGMSIIAFNMALMKEACDYHIKNVVWKLEDGMASLISMESSRNFYVQEGADNLRHQFYGPIVANGVIYTTTGTENNVQVKEVTDKSVKAIIVPEKVRSNDETFDVVSIANGAFADCPNLLEVTFNGIVNIPADAFRGSDVETNLFVYAPEGSVSEYKGNVVIGGEAENIVLQDAKPMYLSRKFRARNVSYSREFAKKTYPKETGGWETIVLPFDVVRIVNDKGEELTPFFTSGNRHFWLAELTPNGFGTASRMAANRPYIISMPNSTEYEDEYNISGVVTFSANNAWLQSTPDVSDSEVNGKDFNLRPTYETVPASSSVYAINDSEMLGQHAGAMFVNDSRAVRPFEAYVVKEGNGAKPRYYLISEGNATGIKEISNIMPENSFDVSGRHVDANKKGFVIKRNSKGKYIKIFNN